MTIQGKKFAGILFILILFSAADSQTRTAKPVIINFPKRASIEICKSSSGEFPGIGAVTIENIRMSSSKRVMKIGIVGLDDKYNVWNKPKPIKYKAYILNSIEKTEERVAVNVDLKHSDGSIDKLRILFEFVNKKFMSLPRLGIMRNFKK